LSVSMKYVLCSSSVGGVNTSKGFILIAYLMIVWLIDSFSDDEVFECLKKREQDKWEREESRKLTE
jgi:hypothetical protein